ncbi:3-ketoacyl-ACP reductase [Sphaerisporangium siamense]|nr:3-ketoacyl-ACP reductase [Sphaerisporangium siamense]
MTGTVAMRAFVTGGTRGIGRAIVEAILPRLDELTVLAAHGSHIRELSRFVVGRYPQCRFDAIAHDLADLQGLADKLSVWRDSAAGGRALDVLVLNAGTYTDGSLLEIKVVDYIHDLNVNLNSYLVAARELIPCLRRGKRPRIFMTGSTAAYEPYPMVPSYGVAKVGLRGLAVNLRRELAAERIGVTFISPGGTLTDMWEGEELPPDRLLRPSDIGTLLSACLDLSEQAVVEEIIVRPMEGDIHE